MDKSSAKEVETTDLDEMEAASTAKSRARTERSIMTNKVTKSGAKKLLHRSHSQQRKKTSETKFPGTEDIIRKVTKHVGKRPYKNVRQYRRRVKADSAVQLR